MAESKKYYWLRLKKDFFGEKEIKKLRRIAGGDTYTVIYLKMQLLSLVNEGKLYFEGVEDEFYKELALDLDEDEENVKVTVLYLEQMGLLECVNADEYFLTRVPELIGSETDKAELMRKNRDKKRKSIESSNNVTELLPPVTKCYTEKEKEIDIDNKKHIVQEACTLFEKLWSLYPNKKGKGQVSDTKKKALLKIGEEELTRAIDRYKEYLKANKKWLKPQNGSTFFNSGYVDYLDANYNKGVQNVSTGNISTGVKTKSLTELALEEGIGE